MLLSLQAPWGILEAIVSRNLKAMIPKDEKTLILSTMRNFFMAKPPMVIESSNPMSTLIYAPAVFH